MTVLFDAAMGTELLRRWPEEDRPDFFSLQALLIAPELVREIHLEHLESGAEIIRTNSFLIHDTYIELAGLKDCLSLSKVAQLSFQLAKEAIIRANQDTDVESPEALVAGSIGPLSPDHSDAIESYRRSAEALLKAGVDFIWAETLTSLDSVQRVLEALTPLHSAFGVSLVPEYFSETDIERVRYLLDEKNIQLLGLNCSSVTSIREKAKLFDRDKQSLFLLPNSGSSGPTHQEIEELGQLVKDKDVLAVGGCCGWRASDLKKLQSYAPATKPGQVSQLRQLLERSRLPIKN